MNGLDMRSFFIYKIMRVCDSHTDVLTKLSGRDLEDYIRSIKKFTDIVSVAVFTSENDFNVGDVSGFKKEIDDLNKKFGSKLILSIEDLGFIKNKSGLGKLIQLKPFSVTLTWNNSNQFGGGANTNLGLTDLGKETVKTLEANDILIDTAHLSRSAFFEVVEHSKFPIYNSHSNPYGIHRHRRNLTDKQIQAIVDSGGYLGITLYRDFCTNNVNCKGFTAKDVAKQFDYLIRRFGHKNFGFGTDIFGINVDKLPTNINGYKDLKKVAEELHALGYSRLIINDLFYKNFISFIKRINCNSAKLV